MILRIFHWHTSSKRIIKEKKFKQKGNDRREIQIPYKGMVIWYLVPHPHLLESFLSAPRHASLLASLPTQQTCSFSVPFNLFLPEHSYPCSVRLTFCRYCLCTPHLFRWDFSEHYNYNSTFHYSLFSNSALFFIYSTYYLTLCTYLYSVSSMELPLCLICS